MRPRLCASLFALGGLLLGCSDSVTRTIEPPDPYPYMKQTSITNCLHNLKLSYNERNVERFSDLLYINYTFFFAPQDVGAEIPELWRRQDEIISATRLFGSQQNVEGYVCDSISVNFVAGVAVPSDVVSSWWVVPLSQVSLFLECRDRTLGTALRYEAVGHQADLTFVQTTETDPVSGLGIWKMIKWVDKPVYTKAGSEPVSWGIIKAMWR